jgi:hypothetical protein
MDAKEFQKQRSQSKWPDISISTQQTDIIGFSCILSQENIPTNIPIF